ncbi:MAG: hypothetical protein LIP05_15220 [Tannerellaceae bacterium]|nr:hypothetical protein [Tannerellaceae bacterium]
MPNVIYCYSVTGKSLAAARLVEGKLPDTEVISMLSLRDNSMTPTAYEQVGFSFPACFGHPLKIVSEIGKSLYLEKSCKSK